MPRTTASILFVALAFVSGCNRTELIQENKLEGIIRYSVKTGVNHSLVKNGLYWEYYLNGAKELEVRYHNGFKEGPEVMWDPSGVTLRETSYRKGLKDGVETLWDLKGVKRSESRYQRDKRDGVEVTFFPDGLKESIVHYKSNVKDGLETGFDEQGRKTHEVSYVNGTKNGHEIFYDYSLGASPSVADILWNMGEQVHTGNGN